MKNKKEKFKNYDECMKVFNKCKHLHPDIKKDVNCMIAGMMQYIAQLALNPKMKNRKCNHDSDEVFDSWVKGYNVMDKNFSNLRSELINNGIVKFEEYVEKK